MFYTDTHTHRDKVTDATDHPTHALGNERQTENLVAEFSLVGVL